MFGSFLAGLIVGATLTVAGVMGLLLMDRDLIIVEDDVEEYEI